MQNRAPMFAFWLSGMQSPAVLCPEIALNSSVSGFCPTRIMQHIHAETVSGDIMRELTNEQYAEICRRHSPKSKTAGDVLRAFVCGGAVCAVGQVLMYLWQLAGLGEDAPTVTSMSLVFLGALFTGLGVYDNFSKLAGAGALVPITGFANSVASPALEFKTEGFVTGLAAKLFIIAGPVLVYGTLASVAYGLILCLI